MNEELQFLKSPDDSPVNVLLNEKAYPLGQYGIGDIVTVKIRDNIIDYEQARRIVGITVTVHNTGREMVVLQTNLPKAKDAAGA
jgi:ribosomal protein L21E